MRNCPAESRLKWSVRPQRSPEEYAPGCSQWSPKFLFAGISCEGDLHTSLGSLVDAKYVIGKRGRNLFFLVACLQSIEVLNKIPFAYTRLCKYAMKRIKCESIIIALFNGCFLDIQRRVPVIIETMNDVSVLACRNRADHEAHGQKPGNHECLSSSAIKYGLKIVLRFMTSHTRARKAG